MKYTKIKEARFISRPNRFIAKVEVDGLAVTAHVKNTGRCRELLLPGSRVWLSVSDNPARRTAYDLVAVEKVRDGATPLIINMDSQLPNDICAEWLAGSECFGKGARIRREVVHGDSRFDFYIETESERSFLEVKGVTLENNGVAMFPDAPTERGVKHVEGLIKAKSEGYGAYILFVIQMRGVHLFAPNFLTHPQFAEVLRRAEECGVKILAIDSVVSPDEVTYGKRIPVSLDYEGK